MSEIDLSIITVNYNVKDFVHNLLISLEKATKNFNTEIFVVDNASSDGSQEHIRNNFPNVKLIENPDNPGFGKANNQALKLAKGKFLVIINPDTLVSEDTFTKLVDFFNEHPDTGMAGCKILNPDGTLQLACRRSFPGPWVSFCKVTGLSSIFPNSKLFAKYNLTFLNEDDTYEVDAISGSFMMLKREVYEKIGGFDEQFFMYGEDLDFCYRVQKAGYKVYYAPITKIIHYKGESTRRSSIDETKYFYNAMNVFVKKHISGSFFVEVMLETAIYLRKIISYVAKRKLVILSLILDFLCFDFALYLSAKFYSGVTSWKGFHPYHLLIIYTLPVLIHICAGAILKIYRKDTLSIFKNLNAIFVGFFILSTLTYFFKEFAYSRAVIIITYVLLFFLLTFWRLLIKIVFKIGKKTKSILGKRTFIVGTDSTSLEIGKKLIDSHNNLRNVIGLIGEANGLIGNVIDGLEVKSSFDNILKGIEDYKINEIIFPSNNMSYSEMMKMVSTCRKMNVDFKLIGNNYDFLLGQPSVNLVDELPLISIDYNISKSFYKSLKRLFDLTFALFMLIFIYPFIYLFANKDEKKGLTGAILQMPEVFTGKMSLVGTKNHTANEFYLGKKGVTGLWNLDDFKNIDEEKLNIFYAKNQTLRLDLEILSKTFSKLI